MSSSASSSSPPVPSPTFVLLALLEECHPLHHHHHHHHHPTNHRSSSSSSSASSASSSSDSAIASSSLLSSPTRAVASSTGTGTAPPAPSSPLSPPITAVVHLAHLAVSASDGWAPIGTVQHARLNTQNALEEIEKLSSSLSSSSSSVRPLLLCSREAIRQSLYPLCANALIARMVAAERRASGSAADGTDQQQEVQLHLFSAQLPLPPLFHAFVPFPSASVPPPPAPPPPDIGAGDETPTEAMESGGGDCEEGIEVRMLEERIATMRNALQEKGESGASLLSRLERITQGYTPAVCSDLHVDSRCVVRARGLPWHVSDLDVAMFFAGLDIPPGGIALCLGPEGRRSGEALVRFCRAEHRELALQRHRRHLHARYIEVYRASGDEFVKHAVGTDSQAVRFALRAETAMAMIVRMRGLPFTATEQQVRDFFSSDGQPNGLLDQPGAILFVHRPDGRPSGDAFVLFGDEQSGRRALAKHRQRMGGRYIELFRTTQAEVQQLFNARAIAQQNAAIASAVTKIGPLTTTIQQNVLPTTAPAMLASVPPANVITTSSSQHHHSQPPQQRQRDCLRLRGLPYEAQVQQVVEFLGSHARHVLYHGVHMIYNSAGHPSGEAFIQMESEQAAAQAAQEMHNKYMEMHAVKKRRYIEVFQCCAEDMSLLLNVLPPPANGGGAGLLPAPMTPNAGPPPLFSLPPFSSAAPPPPSPLLAAFPAPHPQFLPFPLPVSDPTMGGLMLAATGQFPLAHHLYAPAADPQFGPSAELWLRGLRNGCVAIGNGGAPFVPAALIGPTNNGTTVAFAQPTTAEAAQIT